MRMKLESTQHARTPPTTLMTRREHISPPPSHILIEDGIPSIIKSALINFAKRAKTAEVIRDIQHYQIVPYPLQPVPELQWYILSNLQLAADVREMYEKSLAVEHV
jgi:hypothetical protein